MNNKVNKEVCDILEHHLIESVPTIDKIQAKELAFKISSLKALRSIKSDEHHSAKDQLKRIISRILPSDGRKQRSNSTLSIISAEADESGSIVSDDSTTIAGLESLLDSPRDEAKVKTEEEVESNVTEEASGRTQEVAALPKTETTKPAAAAPAPAIINNYQAKVCRHHLLIDLVGETLYNDILCTTEEIRQLRRKSNFWTKYSVDCSSTELGRVRDGIFGEERVKVSSVLPRPIFDIYFRTPLLDAMRVVDAKSILPLEEQPEPCACVVQRVDWARLVDDARRKLERFRKFEKDNSTSEDDLGIRWCSRCFHCHPEPPETF